MEMIFLVSYSLPRTNIHTCEINDAKVGKMDMLLYGFFYTYTAPCISPEGSRSGGASAEDNKGRCRRREDETVSTIEKAKELS